MLKKVCLVILALSPLVHGAPSDDAIHQELRNLLRGVEESVNNGKFGDLGSFFTDQPRITPINQEVISSRADLDSYFNRWFGSGGYLKSLKMSLTADALTELSPDKTWGLVRGSGTEDYILADGRSFPMKTRWTATVVKNPEGHWRILAIHIGTNFLDNPILAKAESALKTFAMGGLLLGLFLGAGLTFLIRRLRKKT